MFPLMGYALMARGLDHAGDRLQCEQAKADRHWGIGNPHGKFIDRLCGPVTVKGLQRNFKPFPEHQCGKQKYQKISIICMMRLALGEA